MTVDNPRRRARRQGNRLGIFLVLLGVALALVGITNGADGYPPVVWAQVVLAAGASLFIFGYPLARLWFWFQAA